MQGAPLQGTTTGHHYRAPLQGTTTGHTFGNCVVGAVSADKIVAQPGTITGSIGVYVRLLNMAPTLKKAGVGLCVT